MIDQIFPKSPINSKQASYTRGTLVGQRKKAAEVVVFDRAEQLTKRTKSSQSKIYSFANHNHASMVGAAEKLAVIPHVKRQPSFFNLLNTLPTKFTRSQEGYHNWSSQQKYFYQQRGISSVDEVKNSGHSAAISKKNHRGFWQPVAKATLTILMAVSMFVSAVIILPEIFYTVTSSEPSVSSVEEVAEKAAQQAKFDQQPTDPQPYQPAFNPDLPQGSWVNIPRIGVYSELIASENPQEALDQGTWMVPDFGRPGDNSQPTIVAAHRYGWDWWWQSDYWKYNSFYLLTETEPGDRVELIYNQRKWTYEIYAAEEGEQITDYSADLILYTCKYLNSPVRHFRYAKVVEV